MAVPRGFGSYSPFAALSNVKASMPGTIVGPAPTIPPATTNWESMWQPPPYRPPGAQAGSGGLAGRGPIPGPAPSPLGNAPPGSGIPNTFVDAAGRAWEYGTKQGGETWNSQLSPTTPYSALIGGGGAAGGGGGAAPVPAAPTPSPFNLDWFNAMFTKLMTPTGALPGTVAPPAKPDTSQAYATTKDTIGRSTAAARQQLLEQLVAAGHDPDSPFAQAQLAGVTAGGTRALGDVAGEVERANERWGETAYQGGIQQRGQDISAREAEEARRWGILPSLLSLIRTNYAY